MMKKSVNWGSDVGLQEKITSLNLKVRLETHGLKGKLAEGELSFNKQMTRRQARKDARDALPVSEAITQDQWSEREQEVAAEAEKVRRGLGTWMSASSAAARNFITDCTPADIYPDQLREAIKAEEHTYRQHETDDASDALATHEATVIELQDFRSTHGEAIGKRTPDIKKNVEQAIAILLFIMIIEGCFNALLFKDAQSSGLLGGMMIAFAVSSVNVLFGVVGGYIGLRNLNHQKTFMKVLGGIVLAIAVSAGIFLNMYVAHFRDAVESGLVDATQAGSLAGFSMFNISPASVLGSMFPNVFALNSLVAIGLLLIGLTIFCIALYEGYDRISDKYPGYGRVWRKERKAYDLRQSVRNGVRDDLSDYFTRCRYWFETQHSRHVAAKREIEKALNELEIRRDMAVAIAARAGDQERTLKVTYRQAHRRERNSLREVLGEQAAIPAYFDEIITPNLPAFDLTKERVQASEAITRIEHNLKALNVTREWLETHIQQVQKGLSSIQNKVQAELGKAREARLAREDQAPHAKSA